MSTLKQKRKHLSCCLPELKDEVAHLPSNEIQQILNKFVMLSEPIKDDFDPSLLENHKYKEFTGGISIREKFTSFSKMNGVSPDDEDIKDDDYYGLRIIHSFASRFFATGTRAIVVQDEEQTMALTMVLKGCHKLENPAEEESITEESALDKKDQFCYSIVYSYTRSSDPRKIEILGEMLDLMVKYLFDLDHPWFEKDYSIYQSNLISKVRIGLQFFKTL